MCGCCHTDDRLSWIMPRAFQRTRNCLPHRLSREVGVEEAKKADAALTSSHIYWTKKEFDV